MDVLELVQRNFNPSEEDNLSKRSAVCHKPHSDPFTRYLANSSSLFFAHPAKCVDVPWWRWDSAGSAVDASRRLINRDDLVSSLDIPTCALTRRDLHTSMTQKKAEEVEWQPFLHQEGEDFRAWDGPTAGALHLLASLYDLKRLLYLLSTAQRLPVWFKISFLILRKEVLLEKGEERSVYNRRWFSSHRKW